MKAFLSTGLVAMYLLDFETFFLVFACLCTMLIAFANTYVPYHPCTCVPVISAYLFENYRSKYGYSLLMFNLSDIAPR